MHYTVIHYKSKSVYHTIITACMDDVVISSRTASSKCPAMLLQTTRNDNDTALKMMDTISIIANSTLSIAWSPSPRSK